MSTRAFAEAMTGHQGPAETISDLLPIAHSILSTEALMSEVAKVYEIDTPEACELLQPGPNDTYLLTTRTERYVARVYGVRWRSLSEVLYEVELLCHLAAKGVSVAVPIAKSDGSFTCPLHMPEGIRQLVLFSFAKGRSLTWENPDHSYLIGQVTAKIHAASDDYAPHHSRNCLSLDYLIDKPMAVLRPFFTDRLEDWDYLKDLAAKLRTRAEVATKAGMDWGVCHGDISSGNICLAEGNLWTAIDFDLSGPGWRAYDFVPASLIARGRRQNNIWKAFLNGYLEIRPFADADLAAVPLFAAISRLWSFGMRAGLINLRGTAAMSAYIDSYLTFFREWESETMVANTRGL